MHRLGIGIGKFVVSTQITTEIENQGQGKLLQGGIDHNQDREPIVYRMYRQKMHGETDTLR